MPGVTRLSIFQETGCKSIVFVCYQYSPFWSLAVSLSLWKIENCCQKPATFIHFYPAFTSAMEHFHEWYYGDLPKFESWRDDWSAYKDRLEQLFVQKSVPVEKQKSAMLCMIDGDDYKVLRETCLPDSVMNKTYDELCQLMDSILLPKTFTFRKRCEFYKAKQEPDERISKWCTRIRRLSVACKFGRRSEQVLLDRFVSGLRPSAALDAVCEEDVKALTLERALEIAAAKEMHF